MRFFIPGLGGVSLEERESLTPELVGGGSEVVTSAEGLFSRGQVVLGSESPQNRAWLKKDDSSVNPSTA